MWEIKRDDTVIASTDKLEYHGEWLGESYVTIDVTSPQPIDFKIGDYLVYRGERYEINYDPIVIKSAPVNIKGDSFKYSGIKLNSLADELTRCDFLDIVLHDNNIHYTALPNFRFFAATVQELADRIQANLNRAYPEKWIVEVAPEYEAVETDKDVVVDKIKCWDALALCESVFKTHFTITGRRILIGATGIPTAHLFKYGRGNGLFEIERSAETDQAIVTRLRAYGSTRNMPQRYYNTHFGCVGSFEIESFTTHRIKLKDPRGIIPNRLFYGSLNGYKLGVRLNADTNILQVEVIDLTQWGEKAPANQNAFNQWWDNLNTTMRFNATEGIDFYNLPEVNREYTDTAMPNNMAVKHLMLPGFPELTLDPYIDSENISKIGIREGVIFFDGSDEELGEVYPSIEGMTAEQLEAAGINCYSTGYLDELISAEAITDDGVGIIDGENVKPKDEKSTFEVTLKDLGFDINNYLTTSTATISFKSGKLVAREFEIVKCEQINNTEKKVRGYKLTLNRIYDEDVQLFFPYNEYNAKAGDKFVLLNIEMPEVYIKAASQKLLEKSNDWLAKNDYARSTYNPKIDEIFMARQHDEAMTSGGAIQSLHDTLKEGMQLLFEDEDLGIDAAITIDTLIIKEEDKAIPTYEVTLKEEKTVGSLQKVQNKIDSISKGLSQGAGGYNADQIRQLIAVYGKETFLSKTQKDTAREPINFQKGITIGNYYQGLVGGKGAGIYVDANGSWVIEADRLNVRQDMQVNNLVVNQAEARGGMVIDTAAYLKISNVTETEDAYLCYFDTHNGTIANLFKIDDVAYCQRWNAENKELKFYKRRVLSVADDYIRLSKNADVNGFDIPEIGDLIIHYGNYTDKNRQFVKVSDVVGGGYEKFIVGLDSVYSQGDEFYFVGRENELVSEDIVSEIGEDIVAENDVPFSTEGIPTPASARWFVGNHNGANIEYKDDELSLNKVKLSVNSMVGEETITDFVSKQKPNENLVVQSDKQIDVTQAILDEYSWVEKKLQLVEPLIPNEEYTFSVQSENANGDIAISIEISDKEIQQYNVRRIDEQLNVKYVTFTSPIATSEINLEVFEVDTIYRVKLEKGNKPTAWKRANYLERALLENTTIEGGLIATSLIQLGYTIDDQFVVQSGINGVLNEDRIGKGIAFWAGGDIVDAEEDAVNPRKAKTIIRHDGTGYMANNTIRFKENQVELGDSLVLHKDRLEMQASDGGSNFVVKNTPTGYGDIDSLENVSQTVKISYPVNGQMLLYRGTSQMWVTAKFNDVKRTINSTRDNGKVKVNISMEWLVPIVGSGQGVVTPTPEGFVTASLVKNDVAIAQFINNASGNAEFAWRKGDNVKIGETTYACYICGAESAELTIAEAGKYEILIACNTGELTVENSELTDIQISQNTAVTTTGIGVYQTIHGTDSFATHWGEALLAVSEQGAIMRFGKTWFKVDDEGITYSLNGGATKQLT